MNKENQDNGIKLTTDEALKLIKELKERKNKNLSSKKHRFNCDEHGCTDA